METFRKLIMRNPMLQRIKVTGLIRAGFPRDEDELALKKLLGPEEEYIVDRSAWEGEFFEGAGNRNQL
jgi:hypothetical protein